jgi:hypothetical protein
MFGLYLNKTSGFVSSVNMDIKNCTVQTEWCNQTILTPNINYVFRTHSNLSECCAYGILNFNGTIDWWYTDDILKSEEYLLSALNKYLG